MVVRLSCFLSLNSCFLWDFSCSLILFLSFFVNSGEFSAFLLSMLASFFSLKISNFDFIPGPILLEVFESVEEPESVERWRPLSAEESFPRDEERLGGGSGDDEEFEVSGVEPEGFPLDAAETEEFKGSGVFWGLAPTTDVREAAKNISRGGSLNLAAFGRKVLTPPNFTEKVTYPP